MADMMNTKPYDFLLGVQNQGLFNPSQINRMVSQAGRGIAQGMRSDRQQMADRARSAGYVMPWLGGGGGYGLGLGGQQAMADMRTNLMTTNRQAQVGAARDAGSLGAILANLAMTPVQQDTPQYVTDAMNAFKQWNQMAQGFMNKFGTGMGDFRTGLGSFGAGAGGGMFGGVAGSPVWGAAWA